MVRILCPSRVGVYHILGADRRVRSRTAALEENPDYVKALSRRSLANEEIGSWSSLSGALEGPPSHLSTLFFFQTSDALN